MSIGVWKGSGTLKRIGTTSEYSAPATQTRRNNESDGLAGQGREEVPGKRFELVFGTVESNKQLMVVKRGTFARDTYQH